MDVTNYIHVWIHYINLAMENITNDEELHYVNTICGIEGLPELFQLNGRHLNRPAERGLAFYSGLK